MFVRFVSIFTVCFAFLTTGCSTFSGGSTETDRFPHPQLDGSSAASRLKDRQIESETELNVATDQLAAIAPFRGQIDDPQLTNAVELLESRQAEFQERVKQLRWRVTRAEETTATKSLEDYSAIVGEAPLPLESPKVNADHALAVLQARLLQFKREIDAVSLHIGTEGKEARLNGNDRELKMQIQQDEQTRSRLTDECLKVEWRTRLAQIAATKHSKLDYGYLLAQPEADGKKLQDGHPKGTKSTDDGDHRKL